MPGLQAIASVMNFLKAQLPRNPSHTYLIDMLRLMLILKSMDSTGIEAMTPCLCPSSSDAMRYFTLQTHAQTLITYISFNQPHKSVCFIPLHKLLQDDAQSSTPYRCCGQDQPLPMHDGDPASRLFYPLLQSLLVPRMY